MKILVTGASGFIGSHLTKYLVGSGHEVTAFCRTPEKIKALSHQNLHVVAGLIGDFPLVKRLVKNQDVVIHCALGWGNSAVEMLERDTLPAVNLFELALEADAKKLIYTSSSIAVGEYRPLMTEETVCRALDMYSATKISTEAYLLALSRASNTECNILRPVYTFGNPASQGCATQPDQRFWSIAKSALAGSPIELIKNDGTQLVWVGDLLKLYQYFLDTSLTRQILVAGSDTQYSWESIARKIIDYTDSSSEIILQDKGWAAGGCIWSNDNMKKILPEAAECEKHLNEHIQHVCDSVSTSQRDFQHMGVSV
jgi:UDP-glucose 4-epimerase